MTRDELLDLLRRELTTGEWAELRPDQRLAELESRLDSLAEKIADLRGAYDEAKGDDLLRALDDLAASASYLRSDVGQLFSETTRLADELRAAIRRGDEGERPEQLALEGRDREPSEPTAESSPESGDEEKVPGQGSLFD